MKQCPQCNNYALFDDTVESCPICNNTLVPYQTESIESNIDSDFLLTNRQNRSRNINESNNHNRNINNDRIRNSEKILQNNQHRVEPIQPQSRRNSQQTIRSARLNNTDNTQRQRYGSSNNNVNSRNIINPTERRHGERNDPPAFETVTLGRSVFRGLVNNVSTTNIHQSFLSKVNAAVFRGIPFRSGNPVYTTTIRISEFSNNLIATEMRDITFYNNAENQLNVGDDITATVKNKHGRLIASSIRNNNTNQNIYGSGQISAGTVRFFFILILAAVIGLCYAIINFFVSGGLQIIVSSLISIVIRILIVISPILLLIFIYRLLLGKHKKH